jgi:fatty acid desaturase
MALSLPELDRVERDKLVDSRGRAFKDFRRTLKPRFFHVWRDILGGYAVLALIVWAVAALDARFPSAFPLIAIGGGLAIGYVVAFIQLFFHEAAHFNIAKTRRANDFLADLFLGLIVGQSIKAYRVVHMDHHRLLGSTDDTERSYFDAVSRRFLLEAVSGIKLLRVLSARRSHVSTKAKDKKTAASGARTMLLLGLALNLSIMGVSAWYRCWSLFFAWPFGIIVVHTAVTAVRQALEHRRFDARSDVDYTKEPHGANTRMFGSGPIASTLGGAGFNRHLLHHWEPQLSYTTFAELEVYLLDTDAAPVVREVTTTYTRTLLRLMRAP